MSLVARLDARPAAGVERPAWWVRLEADDGAVGWGEAAPHPGFGGGAAPTRAALAVIERHVGRPLGALAEGAATGAPRSTSPWPWPRATPWRGAPACRSPRPFRPTTRRWSTRTPWCATPPAPGPAAAGARALKVKVGPDLDAADALLTALRAAAPGLALRVDANGAWTRDQAAAALDRLARHDLAWIEQPCPALADLAWLVARTAVPVAADESVVADAAGAVEVAAVVVLKPAFLGAPLRTLSLAAEAARRGVGVCVTHALESPIGRAGALHVAAALADGGVHGVGGAGPTPLPRIGGLGVTP
ncbi:MAG: hypothetical protein H6704_12835 [Myxococcales bacterium]|nr:hypothetical protein [Myxococcales bacterium]